MEFKSIAILADEHTPAQDAYKNLKSISTILNKKIEFSNNNDRYYFLRMVIRYIIRKRKISKLNKLFYSNMSILFKASLVEMKNYILQILTIIKIMF